MGLSPGSPSLKTQLGSKPDNSRESEIQQHVFEQSNSPWPMFLRLRSAPALQRRELLETRTPAIAQAAIMLHCSILLGSSCTCLSLGYCAAEVLLKFPPTLLLFIKDAATLEAGLALLIWAYLHREASLVRHLHSKTYRDHTSFCVNTSIEPFCFAGAECLHSISGNP